MSSWITCQLLAATSKVTAEIQKYGCLFIIVQLVFKKWWTVTISIGLQTEPNWPFFLLNYAILSNKILLIPKIYLNAELFQHPHLCHVHQWQLVALFSRISLFLSHLFPSCLGLFVAVIVSPCRVQRIWPPILSPLALNSSLRYCLLSIQALLPHRFPSASFLSPPHPPLMLVTCFLFF